MPKESNKNPNTSPPDNPKLRFQVRVRIAEYGDNRKFHEYRIVMREGREVVGIEDGPRRGATNRIGAMNTARQHIARLKAARLFVIRVTKKHINDGEGRNCHTCAISQALWHNSDRMGIPTSGNYGFEVAPYGAWTTPRGIVLCTDGRTETHIPHTDLPDVVMPGNGGKGMTEWAMDFDDWYDSQFESLKEWRQNHGYSDGERPCRPSPVNFVLNLDAFVHCTI